MIFMTAADVPRPVRLDEATRQFAARSLAGQYGDETCRTPAVTLDDIDGIESMDAQQRYDAAVLRIAQQAPLRICPEETVSGAATLGLAIGHAVPATFGGCPAAWGLSHLTLDFPSVLQIGIDGLEEQVDRRLAQPTDEGQRAVLRGMKNAVRAMHIWQERYVAALADVLPENAERMRRVPFLPPRDFREAVQSIWSTFAFARLTGIWRTAASQSTRRAAFWRGCSSRGASGSAPTRRPAPAMRSITKTSCSPAWTRTAAR